MKILAIASHGGHWVQLSRVVPAFYSDDCATEVVYVSTQSFDFTDEGGVHAIRMVPDCNLTNKRGIVRTAFALLPIIARMRPDVIVTTGAAPGIIAVAIGRILGAKCIWLDSIANGDELSKSGRAASFIANECYTQWPHLINHRVKYIGRVI